MSGHSKWHNIKEKKGAADAKRGQVFTKLGKAITVAAREGGGDPSMNARLSIALEQAKTANMPKDTIERAIKRGAGELAGGTLEEVLYEAIGPGGSAFLILTTTDNRNRTVSELKNLISKNSGTLGGPNSAAWQFQHTGIITIAREDFGGKTSDDIQLAAIAAGALDVTEEEEGIVIATEPKMLGEVIKYLKEAGISITDAQLGYVPKTILTLSEADARKVATLLAALENHDDVSSVFSNTSE